MNLDQSHRELLLRFIDGLTTPEESQRIQDVLLDQPEARDFLREVAEQAVMIADLERAVIRGPGFLGEEGEGQGDSKGTLAKPRKPATRRWRLAIASAVTILTTVGVYSLVSTSRASVARVSRVTGANLHFDSSGRTENALSDGTSLAAGDTLESRSCDSWIALDLGNGASLTIAGNSAIRVLSSKAAEKRFDLPRGSLWFSPAKDPFQQRLVIVLPTATVQAHGALMDVQTSESESIVRVHGGSARVTRALDGQSVDVPTEHQVSISLNGRGALAVIPRPRPVDTWSCPLLGGDEVSLGRWLPPTEFSSARLRAAPLLWPIPDRDPLLLHAVAVAAWRSSERPVRLASRSMLRFRGTTQRDQVVRFGFSTQKMRGVFAGKFEMNVPPEELGLPGATWEVKLPLADFQPLHPQLASTPEGLELTDVYALTIIEDAGLEIHQIELLPPPSP